MFSKLATSSAIFSTQSVLVVHESSLEKLHMQIPDEDVVKIMWLTSDNNCLSRYLILQGNIVYSESEDNIARFSQLGDRKLISRYMIICTKVNDLRTQEGD